MALLVGSQTEAANADNLLVEKLEAVRFVAATTGTVEELQIKTSSGEQTGTGVRLAIMAEAIELGLQPGAVLGEGEAAGKPAISSVIAVTGLSVAITSGTPYWLAMISIGGTLRTKHVTAAGANKTALNLAPTKVKKASEVTIWEVLEQGPFYFAGLGTAAGGASSSPAMLI